MKTKKQTHPPQMLYVCRACGYNPRNRADWCDSGCGSDYNQMHAVPSALPGMELALTLALEAWTRVENTVDRVRQIFDYDDVRVNFVLEHNDWCPAARRMNGACACGLDRTHEELREAGTDAEQVRAAINRCIVALRGDK